MVLSNDGPIASKNVAIGFLQQQFHQMKLFDPYLSNDNHAI
jgi:hypothetical protein